MTKYLVNYHLPSGEKESITVIAYNVFHAEKLAKEKLKEIGQVHITSVASVSSETELKGRL